jgi:hypothetical protein
MKIYLLVKELNFIDEYIPYLETDSVGYTTLEQAEKAKRERNQSNDMWVIKQVEVRG